MSDLVPTSPVTPPVPVPPVLINDVIDGVKADLLAGISIRDIAAKYSITKQKVGKVKAQLGSNLAVQGVRKKDLPAKLYLIADLSIKAITPAKLAAASAPQLITTAAIAIDKARLMEGLSTDNMDIRAVVPRIQEQADAISKAQSDVIEMLRSRGGDYEPKAA